jgi:hypothetical protein
VLLRDVGYWLLDVRTCYNERPYVFRFCATKNLNSKKPEEKGKISVFSFGMELLLVLGSVESSQLVSSMSMRFQAGVGWGNVQDEEQ